VAVVGQRGLAAEPPAGPPPRVFRFSLNTGTILGQKVPLPAAVEIAAKAGYDAIEPWTREIQEYVERGGKLPELRKRIADAGLVVPSAIGFATWLADDDQKRAAGLEQARRDMDLVAQLGGQRIAAPPAGATKERIADLQVVAQRYRALLDIGQQIGVVPQLEHWGASKTLSRVGEVAYVVAESGHPDACGLLDIYHIYKSGSPFAAVRKFSPAALGVFHVNDFPAEPPRETINDSHRVYPGDGVGPLGQIFRDLRDIGYRGFLSLELFNREYWKQDPLEVARTGLAKTKAAVDKALAG